MNQLLSAIEKTVLQTRGTVYEGDIFGILKSSPYVLRAFEFSPADGAVNVTGEFDPATSYADRFFKAFQEERDVTLVRQKLLLFDVKSKISQLAGEQHYLTKGNQRQIVAFYIGMRAADPGYVELIPNFAQGEPDDNTYHSVNISRTSKLLPSAYRLDMDSASWRMPSHLLQDAVRRMRACAQGYGDYINPWTMVQAHGWKPLTIDSVSSLGPRLRSMSPTSFIMPAAETEHFSACKAVLEIQRLVKVRKTSVPMALDFVGVQPLLADFKLSFCPPHSTKSQDVYVQHKLDARDRSINTPLDKVAIARKADVAGVSKPVRHYFTCFERFDYLFYEFNNISPGPGRLRVTEIFFIPECEIPDEFYTSTEIQASFEREEFKKYRMRMDIEGRWLDRVVEILLEEKPRKTTRPRRAGPIESSWIDQDEHKPKDTIDKLAALSIHGRALYSKISTHFARQFFHKLMTICAEKRTGLLFALSHENPSGDFGYCRYRWTEKERLEFLKSETPPRTLSDLHGTTNTVPICLFTRDLESTYQGPDISSANFRRLAACNFGRLLVWNIAGPDDMANPGPLAVVPSRDVEATQGQRTKFVKNLVIDKRKEHSVRTPSVSAVLKTGLTMSEYTLGASGPLVYSQDRLDTVWELCERFSRPSTRVEHPGGTYHDTSSYIIPLSRLHERHVEEDRRQPLLPSRKRKRSTP